MSFKNNNVQYIFLCLLFFLPLKFINAAQLFNNNLIEFSLSVQNQTTHFDFPANTYQVKSDQVGISWYESFNKYFQGGLELGYVDMSQIDNPLASAQFSSGQYFGILLRFLPLDYPLASLTLNLNYRYNNTEAKSTNQNSEFAWHETLIFSEVEFRPFDKISLVLAAEYQDLAGEQDAIARYKERVRQAEELNEYALSESLRGILVMEQEHAMDLMQALGK